jgi:hypothetical protein
MHDLDGRIGGELLKGIVGAGKMERIGEIFGAFGRTAERALDGNAEAAESVQVRVRRSRVRRWRR